MSWTLDVAPSAARALDRLPERVATAVIEFMTGPLIDEPERVGRPTKNELTGLWSARRGAYRVVYELNRERRVVRVVRIGHRSDVYRSR